MRCTVGAVELLCERPMRPSPRPSFRHLRATPHRGLREVLRAGMTVVDVGANLGYYSLLASAGRSLRSRRRVRAEFGELPAAPFVLASWTIHQRRGAARGRGHATGWAYYSTHVGSNGGLIDDGDLSTRPGVVVPTFRLDDLVEMPVGLLKMDVEGAEGRVVQGATRIIEHDRPIVTTELKDEMLTRVSGMSVGEYLGYFEGLGYTPAVLEKASGAEKPYPSVGALLEEWRNRRTARRAAVAGVDGSYDPGSVASAALGSTALALGPGLVSAFQEARRSDRIRRWRRAGRRHRRRPRALDLPGLMKPGPRRGRGRRAGGRRSRRR